MVQNREPICLLFSLAILAFSFSSSVHGGSPKRGFAGGGINNTLATNAGWFYHWGLDKPTGDYDSNFVPMFWGNVTQAGINQVLGYGDTTHVLGFNEPERADQANLSVTNAISKWQALEAGLTGSGIKLVSPAVSDNGAGQQWLSNFMGQANNLGLQVDAVAFHWYGVNNPNNPVGAANQLLGRVDAYHNTYGKPVWLTEFALHDWGGNYSDEVMREANRTFLETVIPGLESRSYVEGYSFYQWFGDAMLLEGNPLTPTIVGDAYIPTLETGETLNLQGNTQGDDRIYLKGGSVINSGPTANDAVRYLDAITGTSTLGGSTDWGIASPGWAAIRSEAIVRKEDANRVSISGVTLNSSGQLEFAAGVTSFSDGASLVGSGVTRILPGATVELGKSSDSEGVAWAQIAELHGGSITSNEIATGIHRLDNLVTVHGTTTFSGAGTLAVNGPMIAPSGSRGGGLLKEGTGNLMLTAANSYGGNTILKNGTLSMGSFGTLGGTPYIEIQEQGTWDVSAHTTGYPLAGQTLALAGTVNGSLLASQGATVSVIGSSSLISGDLDIHDATVMVGGPAVAFPITMQIEGDYAQHLEGVLQLDLLDEQTHDALAIIGSATLAGTLDVNNVAGFAPDFGDAFTMVTATGGLTGEFETIQLPALAAGQIFKAVYSETALTLRVAGSTADFDFDGDVDEADLSVWQNSFGWDSAGDADGDGDTDGHDALVWQREYAAIGAGTLRHATVPEPNATVLILLALTCVLRPRFSTRTIERAPFRSLDSQVAGNIKAT